QVGVDQIGLTDGLTATNLNLIPFNLFGSLGTLIVDNTFNTALGFVSSIPTQDLWSHLLSV
ncbi:MAG: hypothetical protein AAFO04_24710, partial [Cyanobacteria bacterium J06592_8]